MTFQVCGWVTASEYSKVLYPSAEVSFKSSQDLATPFITNPLDTGRKLNVRNTFKGDPDVF